MQQLQLNLQVLWVGIGCQRGTPQQLIDRAIQEIFQENQLAQNAIAGIATIETKASEIGLVQLCRQRNLPLKTFPAHILRTVFVPNPSKMSDQEVGTPSVAEAAAILAASKLVPSLMASCLASTENLGVRLLVPKRIFQIQEQPGVVTVAVAQASL